MRLPLREEYDMEVRNTLLGNLVEQNSRDEDAWTQEQALYDEKAKKIIANKAVCARILKALIDEFKNCTLEFILENCFMGDPVVSKIAVHPDGLDWMPEDASIEEMNSEAKSEKAAGKSTVYYDIRFKAKAPDGKGFIQFIINIEVQNSVDLKYTLAKRAVYYACRLVSEQHGREFKDSDYDSIKKVYTIWICPVPEEGEKDTVYEIRLAGKPMHGAYVPNEKSYDLMDIVFVNLDGINPRKAGKPKKNARESGGEKAESRYDPEIMAMLKMLKALLLNREPFEEKKRILEDECHIRLTMEEEDTLKSMYGWSDYFYDQGFAAADAKRVADLKAADAKRVADLKAVEDKHAADLKAAEDKHAADLKAIEDKLDADKKKSVETMLECGVDLPMIQKYMSLDEEKFKKILQEIELEKAHGHDGGRPAQVNAEG